MLYKGIHWCYFTNGSMKSIYKWNISNWYVEPHIAQTPKQNFLEDVLFWLD